MNNIVLKTYPIHQIILGTGHSRRFYVPPGYLKRFPNGEYVSTVFLSRYLMKEGITIQEYYDRWILNITVKSDRPKCPNCGKELPFGRNICEGYRYEFCCLSCKAWYAMEHPDEYPNFQRSLIQRRENTEEFYQYQVYKDYKRSLYESHKMGLIDMYFYIVIAHSYIKVGISKKLGAYDRIKANAPIDGYPYKATSYIGKVEDVCKCEYDIKKQLYDYICGFDDWGWTESFKPSALPLIINTINTFNFKVFYQYEAQRLSQ